MSKIEGVIRVHPFGINCTALVFVSDPDKLTETAVQDALRRTSELSLRKMKRIRI